MTMENKNIIYADQKNLSTAVGSIMERLAARVEAIAGPLVGRLGFSAQRLDGGPVIALNADERFPMASIFKIPIVLAALRRVQAGDLALDDILEVPPDKYVMSPVISTTFIHPGVSLSFANLRPRTAVLGKLRRTLL
jgi:beta-lactamase class A